jgi:hypothetical protein
MIFIFGSRLFGKCDIVPGFFHVATRFGHVDYVPLIPMQSFIILEQSNGVLGGTFRGVPIGMSGKSIAIAWMRCLSIAAIVVGLIMMIAVGSGNPAHAIIPLLIAAAGAGAFAFTRHKSMTHASYDRACQLARVLGLNERGMAKLAEIYQGAPTGFPVQIEPAPRGQEQPTPVAPFASVASDEAAGPIPLATPARGLPTLTFFVTGRNRASNQDVCISIWARDEADARRLATERGIDVTQVERGGEFT